MMLTRRPSPHQVSVPLAAAFLAGILLLAGLGVILISERSYQAQKLRELGVQAEMLAAAATAPLDFRDRTAAQEAVDTIRINREVRAAGIYDESGARFAGYRRSGAALPATIGEIDTGTRDTLETMHAVTRGGEQIGAVYLSAIREPLSRKLMRYSLIALFVVLAALVVSVLAVAQLSLRRANIELERRARELAVTNHDLVVQIEEREKTEEALRQAQKMEAVGQLTGGIAHDFNNLLTGVIGGLELMQRRMAQGRGEEAAKFVDLALDSANRAATLTQRLLAFSRRQSLDPKPTDANGLVAGMEALLQRTLGERVDLRIDPGENLWLTRCDPHQLENALLNLAINARDAMPEGGELAIETCNVEITKRDAEAREMAPGDYVCIAVTDTGTGMTPDIIAKAFEPFFTTKPTGQGTGLGLSMIYGFVRQSDGYIKILSEPGAGTTIKLYLLRYQGEAEMPGAAPGLTPVRRGDGKSILLVEDEEAVRDLAVEALAELGYTVRTAADGDVGLEIVQKDANFDMLITDVGLPGIDGRQLAEAARAVRPDLPVLFISGYAHNVTAGRSLVGRGEALLTKPFSVDELAVKVQTMLVR